MVYSDIDASEKNMNGDQSRQRFRHEVVLLSPLPPPLGGLTVWTTEYMESARSYGLKVKLINTSPGGDRVEAVSRVRLARIGQMVTTVRDIWGALPGADVAHLSTTWYWSLARDGLLGWVCRLRRVPVVMQIHAATNVLASVSTLPSWKRFLLRLWLRPVNVLAVLSQELQVALTTQFPNKRIELIPNWVDTGKFFPASEQCAATVENASGGTLISVFVGRLMEEKGFVSLARAVIDSRDVTLISIGDKPQGTVGDTSVIEAILGELRHTGRYREIPFLSREDIAATLRTADVFVLPSWNEGLPISLLEAMATGLPCVITAVGGMGDLVKESVDAPFALEVPVDDSAAIVDAFAGLSRDSAARWAMGANGRAVAETKFSAPVVFDKLNRIYDELCPKD